MSDSEDKTPSAFEFEELVAKIQVVESWAERNPPEKEPEWKPTVARKLVGDTRRVPERHLQSIYDREPVDCDALRHVREFVADKSAHMLLLLGLPGTRKTGSACWALTQRSGLFVAGRELSRIAMSKFTDEQDLFRSFFKTSFLIFDDLGTEYSDDKGWIISIIDGLVDARYAACLKTIFTSNLSPTEFKQKYGERFADRLRECGRVVTLGGESVRKGKLC